MWTTIAVVTVAIAAPYLPLAQSVLGFVPLPPTLLAVLLVITLLYAAVSELAKHMFFVAGFGRYLPARLP